MSEPIGTLTEACVSMTSADAVASSLDAVLERLSWRFVDREEIDLPACDRIFLPPGAPTVLLVNAGLVRVESTGRSQDLAPGDFLFVPRGKRFSLLGLSTASVLRLLLTPVASEDALTVLPETVVLTGFMDDEPMAAAMLRTLVTECARPHGVVGDRTVTLLASIAVSSWHARGCAPRQWLMQVSDPDLARAVAAIRADPGRAWTVDSLARIALTSRSSFAARFRAATGQTPGRYLAGVRIEHAQRQLAHGDLSIAAIGHRLGYGSDTAFGRAFRRHTGLTPTEWQRRLG